MNKKTITLIIVFFLVLVIGMFTFAYLKKTEMVEEPAPQVTEDTTPEVEYASITRIDGKHYFIDGVHTVVGEVPMPTPCDLLEADASVAQSLPEEITLLFSVINNSDTCLKEVTLQRFKVSAAASEDARFQATFMGRPIELNLIPAAPGETPDEFEVFLKG